MWGTSSRPYRFVAGDFAGRRLALTPESVSGATQIAVRDWAFPCARKQPHTAAVRIDTDPKRVFELKPRCTVLALKLPGSGGECSGIGARRQFNGLQATGLRAPYVVLGCAI